MPIRAFSVGGSSALLAAWLLATGLSVRAAERFTPPVSPRATYNFNPDWKFIRQDVAGAEAPGFNDAAWANISTPHTYNDVDTFNKIISHGGGQAGAYMGIAWYRKHFKLPAELAGRKVFLEFEGMRQAGEFYLNGKQMGLHENGITAYGIDITAGVSFGEKENVLAVKIDNDAKYVEKATRMGYEWASKDFNPNYGGLNRHVWLHVAGPIYQTLPLMDGLKTTGTYIYPSNISVPQRTADINIESQVHNESGAGQKVALSAVIIDADGMARANFTGPAMDMAAGDKAVLRANGPLSAARFWGPDDPYLYDVYTILTVDGKTVDVTKTTTGFRKAEFRGGAGTGGVYINDKFVYLKGYAQRSTDEWAGLGQSYPDWMHDLNAKIVRDSNGNYMRWMHISPQKVDVQSYDRYGIVEVCPAGDKEKDSTGRQWEQRMEVMRSSMVYMRNHPSIFFWEVGNSGVTAEHMKQMKEIKDQFDPKGGRALGCRSLTAEGTIPVAEYFGVMIGQDKRTDALKNPTDTFRAFSFERRDKAPVIETEDFRDEAARRFWDDQSPPYFGFKPGPLDTYHWNSETFALAAAERYYEYYSNRISNTDKLHARWSGYASIYFFDSNADGRQDSSEVCRVSGKVDAVRLPKEAFYTYRVMQAEQPDIHIIGHWTYPGGTKKTMHVVCNCQAVELFLDGQLIGKSTAPTSGYIFSFPNVTWKAGTLKAVGSNGGNAVAAHELKTAGSPVAIKLTPIVGPKGLQADGQDVALFDVEAVDATGMRCPTDDARVDFALTGPGIWRGGYNSGKIDSTNNRYLNTECGINRVSVRATRTAGPIKLTATRAGLQPGVAEVVSQPVKVENGLMLEMPPTMPPALAKAP